MSRPSGLSLVRENGVLRAVMPSGRNPYYYIGALAFSLPWLVAVVIGVVYAIRTLPASDAGLVWAAALLGTLALTVLLDLVALALIWFSLYSLFGSEILEISSSEILVKRRAAGLSLRASAKRGHFDRASRLDPRRTPGRVPHPSVEISGAYSRLRVGSGLAADEAGELVGAIRSFIRECGPQQVHERAR